MFKFSNKPHSNTSVINKVKNISKTPINMPTLVMLLVAALFIPVTVYFLNKDIGDLPKYAKDEKQKSVEEYINMLKSQDYKVKKESSDALVNMGDMSISSVTKELDNNEIPKGEIIYILGEIKSTKATGPLLNVLNTDDNDYIKRSTIKALGKIKDEKSYEAIKNYLSDNNTSIRENTVYALGEIGNTEIIPDLIKLLNNEKNESVKTAIVVVLGKFRNKIATKALVNELNNRNNYLYDDALVYSLGEIGDKEALNALESYLNKLISITPTEKMLIFVHDNSIRIVKEAIREINDN